MNKTEYGVVVDGKVIYRTKDRQVANAIASEKEIDAKGNLHDVYIIDRKVAE